MFKKLVTHVNSILLQIRKKQEFVLTVLQGKKIPFEEIDISDAANVDDKLFMKDQGKPSGSDSVVLPPQIFNNSIYCGVSVKY